MTARPSLPVTLLVILALAGCRQAPPPPESAAPEPQPALAETAAQPPAIDDRLVPRAFLCRGNEPFWALDIHATGALLKTPDAELPLTGELRASAAGAYAFRGLPADGDAGTVEALLAPAQCFDTMADGPAMPFRAEVGLADGQPGSGCCTVEYGLDLASAPAFDPSARKDGDWSRLLPELASAMARCAGDAGVATEAVTWAWPMNQGKGGIRLRDAAGDRFDCIVDLERGRIVTVGSVAPAESGPGEGQPLWLPAGDMAPILTCGHVEQTLAADGSVTGYLHYRDGCADGRPRGTPTEN